MWFWSGSLPPTHHAQSCALWLTLTKAYKNAAPTHKHKFNTSCHVQYYFGLNLPMPLRLPSGPVNILLTIRCIIAFTKSHSLHLFHSSHQPSPPLVWISFSDNNSLFCIDQLFMSSVSNCLISGVCVCVCLIVWILCTGNVYYSRL